MTTDLTALIVDRRTETAEALIGVLENEFQLISSECVGSMHSALESQSTNNFQVCFISEQFGLKELEGFFRDMRSIGKDKSCVFIQLRDTISEKENRDALKSAGFTTMVTPSGTREDRAALRAALHALIHAREMETRTTNIESVTKVTLKEIDRIANDRKRGFNRPIPPGYRTMLEFHADFDSQLLQSYFETLQRQTAEAQPLRITAVEIPEKVLNRKLPHLQKSRYVGASHRVWEMLKEKHGKKDGSGPDESKSEQPAPPRDPKEPAS